MDVSGGDIEMYADYYGYGGDENTVITNSAAYSAAGGNGTATGGEGGYIYFQSSGGPTVDTATDEHDVSGGTGDEPGPDGSVEYNDGPWT